MLYHIAFIQNFLPLLKYKQLFIASYYKQLSADIKMKPVLLALRCRRHWLTYDITFLFSQKSEYNMIQYMIFQQVWLRTGSNPADINRFRSHTGIIIIDYMHLWWNVVVFNLHFILYNSWYFLSKCLSGIFTPPLPRLFS